MAMYPPRSSAQTLLTHQRVDQRLLAPDSLLLLLLPQGLLLLLLPLLRDARYILATTAAIVDLLPPFLLLLLLCGSTRSQNGKTSAALLQVHCGSVQSRDLAIACVVMTVCRAAAAAAAGYTKQTAAH